MKYTTFLKKASRYFKALTAFLLIFLHARLPAPAFPAPAGLPPIEISEKEIDEMLNYLKNLDDAEIAELERQAKANLRSMGIDPETFKPLTPEQPVEEKKPPMPEVPEIKPETKPVIEPPKNIVREMPGLLGSLIRRLDLARLKVPLKTWLPDTNKLINTLLTINTSENYQRLAATENDKLRWSLERLNRALETYEPILSMPIEKPQQWEDPYEILGLMPSATQEAIDEAYAEISQRFDISGLRQRLMQAQWSAAEIEKALREAQINADFVKDAYERIKDPQSRAIVNQELQAIQTAQQATTKSLESARQAITSILGNAIYQDQLLNGLEQFIKKYEPEELALRKQMEKEQAERLKEHKAFAAAEPYGKTIHIRPERPSRGAFGSPWERPSLPSGERPSFKPSGERAPEKPPQKKTEKPGGKGKPGGVGGGKPGGKKEEEKEEEKKEEKDKEKKEQEKGKAAGKEKDKEKKEEKKESYDALAQQLLDLDQRFFMFNEHFDKPFFENLQKATTPAEELTADVTRFAESTHLNDLTEKLTYVEKSLQKAKDRQKKQYKTLWKSLEKNTKDFAKNIELAQKAFDAYTEKQLATPDGQTLKKVSENIKAVSETFGKIQEEIGEKKKKTPTEEMLSKLAPPGK